MNDLFNLRRIVAIQGRESTARALDQSAKNIEAGFIIRFGDWRPSAFEQRLRASRVRRGLYGGEEQ